MFQVKPQKLAMVWLLQDNSFGELICSPHTTHMYVLEHIEEDLH